MNRRRSVAKAISGDEYITYLALENDRVAGFIGLIKKINEPYDLQMVCSIDMSEVF